MWNPIGNAQTGSQYIISSYGGTPPPPGSLYRPEPTYLQAKQLLAATPMPAGEWYYLPIRQGDTAAQIKACLAQPLYFWDVPGQALPGIDIPPVTLAQLAMSKLRIPGAGTMHPQPADRRQLLQPAGVRPGDAERRGMRRDPVACRT